MKLPNLSFLLLLLVAFASCDDDEDNLTMMSDLEGSWSAQSLVATSSTSIISPDINTNINVELIGSALDYDLVFSDAAFTANGSYNITTEVDNNGTVSTSTDSYTSVDNMGAYSTSGNEITFNGGFFTLEFNGQTFGNANTMQTSDFTISGDILTINQPEMVTTDTSGDIVSTTRISSISTWRRN